MSSNDFYLRYYVGHKGKFGHEFLEFEFRPDGKFNSAAATACSISFSLISITIIGAQHKWSVRIYKRIFMYIYIYTHKYIFIYVHTR